MSRLSRGMKSFEVALYVTGFWVIYNKFVGPMPSTDAEAFIVLATMTVGLYLIDVHTGGAFVEAHRMGPTEIVSRLRAYNEGSE